MNEFEIEIVTPESSVYSGSVVSASIPGTSGKFQVLHNHAPLISTVGTGVIALGFKGAPEKTFSVAGGVVEVLKNRMIVLVEKVFVEAQKAEEEN